MKPKFIVLAVSLGVAMMQAGCAQNGAKDNSTTTLSSTGESQKVASLQRELERSKEALEQERELRLSSSQSAGIGGTEPLLPPGAKPGECYARVWVEPSYRTLQKTITVQEASESVEIIPAEYRWEEEQVMVQEASSRLVSTPAVYGTETETLLVRDAERMWVSDLKHRNAVSSELLRAARNGGIDIDGAPVNSCYHEHVVPAKTRQTSKEIEVSAPSFSIETVPAEYRMVEKRILVKEASSRLVNVPAKYETFSEQIIDKPAHTTWKKGTGPIQKIDAATGEIMCLVEVPATYKTIQRRRLVSEATTQRIEIPAEYETVKVRELVSSASQRQIEIPAKYKTVTSTETISEPEFVWHEISDTSMSADSRTGNKICLIEKPAKYQTVTRRVVKNEAYTNTVDIPAVFETKKVKKLVREAQEVRNTIPAVTKTVSYRELEKEGFMEWRDILCDTNVTPSLISRLQQKLNAEGYEAGTPDGVIGQRTIQAVNAYQRDNNLPQDRYLNMKTLQHLKLIK